MLTITLNKDLNSFSPPTRQSVTWFLELNGHKKIFLKNKKEKASFNEL